MRIINIHEAKTHLSRLANSAAEGEAFIIAKAGKPLVQVIPYTPGEKAAKRIGFMPSLTIPESFDELGAEEIGSLFAGEGE